MIKTLRAAAVVAAAITCAVGLTTSGQAEQRIAYKSAKSGTSYYQMGVELANAIKTGTKGDVILTVEESQGSVQNVMEAAARTGNYVFTSPPGLVRAAMASKGPFKDRPKEPFSKIRVLFPIPSLTMHFVVRSDKNAVHLADLAGKTILLGKGSFGAREGAKYIKMFGLDGKVTIADAELGNAADALKNGQIDGFVTAGSFPAPNVIEASANTPIALVTMGDDEIAKTHRTKQIIPAGTYAGVDTDVATTSLSVDAFTTTDMSDDTAYVLTKTFWAEKAAMSKDSRWWKAVDAAMLAAGKGVKLHPGALRYYDEAGIKVPDAMR